MGLSFYQRKPGHPELGWLRRCACCSELGPRAVGPDVEKMVWLANTIHAIFCSSERCDGMVRGKLREMFGELVVPASPGALPQCALCGRFDHCNTVRLGEETIAWVCGSACHKRAERLIVEAWPNGLPYVDTDGYPTERAPLEEIEIADSIDDVTDADLTVDPLEEIVSNGEILSPPRGDTAAKLRATARVTSGSLRAWTRGVVWLPEPASERAHQIEWRMQAPFRPFALFFWAGHDLRIVDLRVNGDTQLIGGVGIPGDAFPAGVSIERFRELVSPPGRAEGNLPTINQANWDRLMLDGCNPMHLELDTIGTGQSLAIGLSGEYFHGCIVGKCLAVDRAAAERGEA